MPIRPVVRSSLLGRPAMLATPSSTSSASTSHIRTFAASSQCRAGGNTNNPLISATLPPESPNYIKYPEPPQQDKPPREVKRGHLPVPRNVFKVDRKLGHARDDPRIIPKTNTDAFVARATPVSKSEELGQEPRSEKEAWRRRMAAARRENLQTGLAGLLERKDAELTKSRTRSAANFARNRAAAMNTKVRDDERLTLPSVREVTAKNTAVIRDPLRHERQAAMAANTEAVAQAKREARRDAVMELYQMAGNFIVDEKDLEQRVSALFHPSYFTTVGYRYGMVHPENVWDVDGRPPSIAQQMSAITRTETKLYDARMSESDRTAKRQKLVSEALTGGKIP